MQLWNYFTSNYIGHPLGVRDKCFCDCKHRKKIHFHFLANLLKQGKIIFKMQFLTPRKEYSWCSLEFPNKRENTAKHHKFFRNQRNFGPVKNIEWSLSPFLGHQEGSGSGRQDPLTLKTKTSLCKHPDT